MVDLKKPIMFVGGAGVGKTQLVMGKLGTLPEEMMSLSISFNYFTDVLTFQKVCATHNGEECMEMCCCRQALLADAILPLAASHA